MVSWLREQSRAANRLDCDGGPALAPWELQLSAAIAQDKWAHVGVYGSEEQAARAHDRALLTARGLEGAGGLNFPLADYASSLSESRFQSLCCLVCGCEHGAG